MFIGYTYDKKGTVLLDGNQFNTRIGFVVGEVMNLRHKMSWKMIVRQ